VKIERLQGGWGKWNVATMPKLEYVTNNLFLRVTYGMVIGMDIPFLVLGLPVDPVF